MGNHFIFNQRRTDESLLEIIVKNNAEPVKDIIQMEQDLVTALNNLIKYKQIWLLLVYYANIM
jgi:hypothetical protein